MTPLTPGMATTLIALALVSGCSSRVAPSGGYEGARAPATAPTPNVVAVPAPPAGYRARNWEEYRQMAARRIVAANPSNSYMGRPPEPLLAIPVLEVDLNADGSVASVRVQRKPSQAEDTVQLAMDAVRRAGPFGSVSHLPKPWRFSEVFLFDDARRFKPRSLD